MKSFQLPPTQDRIGRKWRHHVHLRPSQPHVRGRRGHGMEDVGKGSWASLTRSWAYQHYIDFVENGRRLLVVKYPKEFDQFELVVISLFSFPSLRLFLFLPICRLFSRISFGIFLCVIWIISQICGGFWSIIPFQFTNHPQKVLDAISYTRKKCKKVLGND